MSYYYKDLGYDNNDGKYGNDDYDYESDHAESVYNEPYDTPSELYHEEPVILALMMGLDATYISFIISLNSALADKLTLELMINQFLMKK